ncbi:lysophospholipid acyltransferase family protein [Thalassotalea sp. PLHSN55]|uniref:lysophospholipid acyltransferase family protein n=1 Tax=Thalassotalea sp. PLHSN55 TaxID=3435888 RepID=UPI003F8317C3
MKKLNYCWRLFATGFCFSVFGLGGLIISIFVCPIQVLIYRNKSIRKQKALTMVHHLFKFFVFLLKVTGVSHFTFSDEQKLTQLKGHIVMANHPSLIDVVVLISLIPNADCVVKANLFRNPFIRSVLKNTGYISNDSVDGLIEDCNNSLKQGNNLIIFPEGTRSTPGESISFQRGAANIALRCNAPVTTVLIKVTPTTLTKAEKWYHIPEKRFEFSLRLTQKQPSFKITDDTAMSKLSRQFTSALEQHFIEELERV